MNQVLEAATIRQSCKQLRLPTIGAQCGKVAAGGTELVNWIFVFATAAYNLVRMRKLVTV